ncbi:MAG TPA: ABC transporter permease subunit [Rectinemataceae bacterium]
MPNKASGRLAGRGPALLALLPLALLVATFGLLPFGAAVGSSLVHDVYGQRSWAGLESYRLLVEDRAFALSLGISLAWATLSTILTAALGFALACALLEAGNGFSLLFASLLVPWGVPSFISVPLWRMILHGSGGRSILTRLLGLRINLLTDPAAGFFASLGVEVWLGVPLTAFAVYAALGAADKGIIESAKMDGAGSWAIARWIRAPLARNTVLVMAALDFVKSFKEFSVPFLMTAGGPPFLGGITERHIVGATTTLEIFLYEAFRDQADASVPSAYAVAVGLLVMVLVAAWLALRSRLRQPDPARNARIEPRFSGQAAEAAWKAFLLILGLMFVISSAALLYAVVWLSFSDLPAAYLDSLLPRFLSARPFRLVLGEEGILKYFLNTFLVAGTAAFLAPLVVFPAARALSRSPSAASAKAFAGVQALGMAGGMHSLIPLVAVFKAVGLLGGYAPVILVYVFHALPFSLFTIKAFMERLSPELEDAASIEGMGRFSYAARILLPLSAPALAASMMAAFISAWNGFLVPLVFLSEEKLFTIGVKLHGYVGSAASGNPQWNLFAAASVLNMAFVGLLMWKFKDPLRRNPLADAG